ncbi:hypothetical protein DPMN_149289, partial [Dreissena polymorpha]
ETALPEVCLLPEAQLEAVMAVIISSMDWKQVLKQIGIPADEAGTQKAKDVLQFLSADGMLNSMTSFLPNIGGCSKIHEHVSKHVGTAEQRQAHWETFWSHVGPVLCSSAHETPSKDYPYDTDMKTLLGVLSQLQDRAPAILFAPNNSLVMSLMKKANESLEFLDKITRGVRRLSGHVTEFQERLLMNMSDMDINRTLLNKIIQTISQFDHASCTWMAIFGDVNMNVFRGFSTEVELEDYFLNKQFHDHVTVIAGIVFENLDTSLPVHVRYKIRQNATLNPPTNQVRMPFWYPSPGSNNLDYYNFGFVWIQDAIDRAIIYLQTGGQSATHGVLLHRMPYPCWNWDQFVWLIQHIVPLCLMLSWVYSVAVLVMRIVYEKEHRLKEVMKMMGLGDGVHWCGWMLTSGAQFTLTAALLTLMLHFGNVLPRSDPWIVFLFLESFAMSSIAFSFLIGSLYSKAKLAAACAGIFYFVTYVPYIYIAISESVRGMRISCIAKMFASLLSTTALGLGGKYFLMYELEGTGVQWANLSTSPQENNAFSLLHVLLMTSFDTILYFVLAWYIENVHPGSYGIPKPWFFPLSPKYWCGVNFDMTSCDVKRLFGIRRKYDVFDDTCDVSNSIHTGLLRIGCHNQSDCPTEADDPELIPAVVVNNLRKTYGGSDRSAVDGLSFTLYQGHVTAFLGRNGAGKTTTMHILTGLFPPTSGTATLFGKDIRTDMSEIRQNIGVCPQHNVLFQSMTVAEHIWFYSRIKGISQKDTRTEIKRFLSDLSMEDKQDELPDALSGGMQRKLSVAMAFVGGATTVFLDEPTAGVDPYSRRAIWNLLTHYKTGRTVLVSTHYLDEAEAIGDRILIIADGRIRCGGTPVFLKSNFGDGHVLTIEKDRPTTSSSHILHEIQRVVPRAFIRSDTGSDVRIVIPVHGRERRLLSGILRSLTQQKGMLGIGGFSVSDTGLEDVFVKVTSGVTGGLDPHIRDHGSSIEDESCPSGQQAPSDSRLPFDHNDDDVSLLNDHYSAEADDNRCQAWNHLRALLRKRLWLTVRNRKALFSQIVLPAVFVSISMTIALTAPKVSDPDPVTMTTTQFFDETQPKGNYVPFSVKHLKRNEGPLENASMGLFSSDADEDRYNAFIDKLANTLLIPSGLGASCLIKLDTYVNSIRSVNNSRTGNNTVFSYNNISGRSFNEECVRFLSTNDVFRSREFSAEHVKSVLNGHLRGIPKCSCKKDNTGFSCDSFTSPSEVRLITGDVIQNITSSEQSEDDYFLYTTDDYRLHRYGGLTFGGQLPYFPAKAATRPQGSDVASRLVDMMAVKEFSQVWYNQKGFHSMPVYLNAMNNALLRATLSIHKGDPATYGITLVNHPMKQTANDYLNSDYINGGTDVLMAIFIIVAMAFVPASFVVTLVHERAVKAKHLQMSSGLHPVVYWASNFIWDMVNYLLPAVCIILVLLAFNIAAYTQGDNFMAVVLLFLVYGWSMTPLMYPVSFLFREPSVAYICMIVVNLFTGITCVQVSFMLRIFDFEQNISGWNGFLGNLFLIFPNYCLGHGMMTIALNHYSNQYYSHMGYHDKVTSAMTWNITGKRLVAMAIVGVVSLTVTLLCEYGCYCWKRHNPSVRTEVEDDDVDIETERQRTLMSANDNKVYTKGRKTKIRAVDDLTFSVSNGECLGLLGVNGAGKTSTFRMLTGDLASTSGDVKILSQSVHSSGRSVQRHVGYCPQFDAIFDELTPIQHLQLYATLRGVPTQYQHTTIRQCLASLNLQKYADQMAGTLSGGNKRKLSTAIALIGDPAVVLLDEPTSGMDPCARRHLWDVINKLTSRGTAVVFSSHSMEECESLCSRLAIMSQGRLRCIGTLQHLKDKYGSGYTVTVTLTSSTSSGETRAYIEEHLRDATLKYQGVKTLVFDVVATGTDLPDMFETLEGIPEYLGVSDFSVNQNTLDKVFIQFALESQAKRGSMRGKIRSGSDSTDDVIGIDRNADDMLIELADRNTSSHSDDSLLEIV